LRGDVVVNLSTSRAIEDIAARFGVRVHRTKVGEANVVRKLLETGAALGGEGNGGVILPAINLTRDGLVAAATVLGLLSAGKRSLAELRQELPDYYLIKEVVPVPGFDINRLVEQAGVIFSGEVEIDQSDGVRFSGEGWWVHIRQSNTEPVIRLVAESSSRQAAEEIVSKVRAIIKGVN
jgi:phosphomannomutase